MIKDKSKRFLSILVFLMFAGMPASYMLWKWYMRWSIAVDMDIQMSWARNFNSAYILLGFMIGMWLVEEKKLFYAMEWALGALLWVFIIPDISKHFHFFAFSLLSFLLMRGFPKHPWRIAGFIYFLCILNEVFQVFMPYRHPSYTDIAINAFSASFGIGYWWVLLKSPDKEIKNV